eukprot:TRINITY_DN1043_c0_g2_i2.p1 TRINITY_DN1043_c0_g2~~TRINITY_DN1043_c0_g2_i2.p1  ORF type:complete len:405 (+),score=88.60 TRINITY_DN1043_c0_g2_i2:83-1216(+)
MNTAVQAWNNVHTALPLGDISHRERENALSKETETEEKIKKEIQSIMGEVMYRPPQQNDERSHKSMFKEVSIPDVRITKALQHCMESAGISLEKPVEEGSEGTGVASILLEQQRLVKARSEICKCAVEQNSFLKQRPFEKLIGDAAMHDEDLSEDLRSLKRTTENYKKEYVSYNELEAQINTSAKRISNIQAKRDALQAVLDKTANELENEQSQHAALQLEKTLRIERHCRRLQVIDSEIKTKTKEQNELRQHIITLQSLHEASLAKAEETHAEMKEIYEQGKVSLDKAFDDFDDTVKQHQQRLEVWTERSNTLQSKIAFKPEREKVRQADLHVHDTSIAAITALVEYSNLLKNNGLDFPDLELPVYPVYADAADSD